jgi:hypothetical protein
VFPFSAEAFALRQFADGARRFVFIFLFLLPAHKYWRLARATRRGTGGGADACKLLKEGVEGKRMELKGGVAFED